MTVDLAGTIRVPYNPELFSKTLKYRYKKKDDTFYYGVRLTKDKKYLLFPRDLVKFTSLFPDVTFNDLRISPKVTKSVVASGLKLKDFQEKSAKEIENLWDSEVFDVILNAETGWGKSYVISEFLARLQLKTTILVDKTLLANQMYSEISRLTNADVAILTKDSELHDVNIVTFQLLQKNPELLKKLQDNTGFVIADEAHIVAAETFSEVVSGFSAKYRLSLSGSMSRSDGLTEALFDICGRHLVIGKNPEALHVHVHAVETGTGFYSGLKDYKKKLTRFIKSQANTVEELSKFLVAKGRHLFIVVDTHELQEFYAKLLNTCGIPTAIMNSDTSHTERDKILEDLAQSKLRAVIGMAVLEKGISIPILDTIIHLSGATTKEKTIQLIGRLKRDHKDKKTPMFIDFWFCGNLEKQQKIRRKVYVDLGNSVTLKEFSSYEIYKTKFK